MNASVESQAISAATSVASSLGLTVEDVIVLHNSNKLTLRLLPADVVARVAPKYQQVAQFEIDLASQLMRVGSPVAAPDPRVELRPYERDSHVITFWAYYEPVAAPLLPLDYASALRRLHAGMRMVDISAPRFTDRVEEAEQLIASRELTPALPDDDRSLLATTLRRTKQSVCDRMAPEQLLHGEPHPGNVVATNAGPLFVDLETCCTGPIEFDLAHAPAEVSEAYPGLDSALLQDCRTLALAMITAWRWDRADQLPNGRLLAAEWLEQIRAKTRA